MLFGVLAGLATRSLGLAALTGAEAVLIDSDHILGFIGPTPTWEAFTFDSFRHSDGGCFLRASTAGCTKKDPRRRDRFLHTDPLEL
jgi:hypothetical protein